MKPWKMIDAVDTKDGKLELFNRAHDFLITIDGRELMGSMHTKSEVELATWGCGPILDRPKPRVLTAGLGLGFTLRAALDALPESATVVCAELNPVVVDWCRGPVASLSKDALSDPRVELVVGDVMDCVRDVGRGKRKPFDAVVIDLYEGPNSHARAELAPLYGEKVTAQVKRSLTPGGVYAVWGEEPDAGFVKTLERAGFRTSSVRPRGPGRRHVIYVAIKTETKR